MSILRSRCGRISVFLDLTWLADRETRQGRAAKGSKGQQRARQGSSDFSKSRIHHYYFVIDMILNIFVKSLSLVVTVNELIEPID